MRKPANRIAKKIVKKDVGRQPSLCRFAKKYDVGEKQKSRKREKSVYRMRSRRLPKEIRGHTN